MNTANDLWTLDELNELQEWSWEKIAAILSQKSTKYIEFVAWMYKIQAILDELWIWIQEVEYKWNTLLEWRGNVDKTF